MTFRSTRNRIIGAMYLIAATFFLLAAITPHAQTSVRFILATATILMCLIGIRLLATSSLHVSVAVVIFRNKWLKPISIDRGQIEYVEMGTRLLAYERAFPRIHMITGRTIDLLVFEQSLVRAQGDDSSVKQIINAMDPGDSAK